MLKRWIIGLAIAFAAAFAVVALAKLLTTQSVPVHAATEGGKLGVAYPQPTGNGVPYVLSGQYATAAVSGDAGFLLTSNGTAAAPYFAPIANIAGSGVNEFTDSGTQLTITPTEVRYSLGQVYETRISFNTVQTTDNTTWQTIATFTPGTAQEMAWILDCSGWQDPTDGAVRNGDHIMFQVSFAAFYDPAANPYQSYSFTSLPALNIGNTVQLAPLNVAGRLDGGAVSTTTAAGQVTIQDAGPDANAATTLIVQLHGPNTDPWRFTCGLQDLGNKP